MKIGELAELTGSSVQTIRYYEKEGVIASAARTEGNFRLYDRASVDRLMFIQRCRRLGLSLSEIRSLLRLQDSPTARCDEINQMIAFHLKGVEQQIKDMKLLHRQLGALQKACSSDRSVQECGILDTLTTP